MTREARLLGGIILTTVPSIQYGGYFLLTSLMNKTSGYMDNPLRQIFFRAGHTHAGVIVILSLVCQILADAALLPPSLLWTARIEVPLAAILISAGFSTRVGRSAFLQHFFFFGVRPWLEEFVVVDDPGHNRSSNLLQIISR